MLPDDMSDRCYLDHAATSFPKPPGVLEAVRQALESGGSYHRGQTHRSEAATEQVERCRRAVAELFGWPSPRHVAFMLNGTDSLNAAIFGLHRTGDAIAATPWEHNSVVRPLFDLQSRGEATIHWLAPAAGGSTCVESWQRLNVKPRLLVATHASNVTGVLQPIREQAELAREVGARVVLDASQTAGHRPFDDVVPYVDAICCSGHKGLLGPLGTGVLLVKPEVAGEFRPWRLGGSGTRSEDPTAPTDWPARLEAGSPNLPGIAGLAAGIAHLKMQTLAAVAQRERMLAGRLRGALKEIPQVTLYGSDDAERSVGIVSFNIQRWEPHVAATILDDVFHVEVRAGLHCAPHAHAALGTLAAGGTLRASVGLSTTEGDVDRAAAAIAEIAAQPIV